MSDARSAKSGLSLSLKISSDSLKNTSMVAKYLLSTLRQAAHRLPASGSLQESTLLSLYQSMTSAERAALIGHLQKLNGSVGSLYMEFLKIDQCERYSRMGSMTLHSFGELMAYVHFQPPKTLCCSTTHYNRRASKA